MEEYPYRRFELPPFSDAFNTVFSNKNAFQEYINRREEDRRLHRKQMRYYSYVDAFLPNSYDTLIPFESVPDSCSNHLRMIPKAETCIVKNPNLKCHIDLPEVQDSSEKNFLSFIYEPFGPNIPIRNLKSPSVEQSIMDSEDIKCSDLSLEMCTWSTNNDQIAIAQESQTNSASDRQIPLAGKVDFTDIDLSHSREPWTLILEESNKSNVEDQNVKLLVQSKFLKTEKMPVPEICDINDNVVLFSRTENCTEGFQLNTDVSRPKNYSNVIPEELAPNIAKSQSQIYPHQNLSKKKTEKRVEYEVRDTSDKKAPRKIKEQKSSCQNQRTKETFVYEGTSNSMPFIRKDDKSNGSPLNTNTSPMKNRSFLRSQKSSSYATNSQNRLVQGHCEKAENSTTHEICDSSSKLINLIRRTNNCKSKLDVDICGPGKCSTLITKESSPNAVESQDQMHPFKSVSKKHDSEKLVSYICEARDKMKPLKIKGRRRLRKRQKAEKSFAYEICDISNWNPGSLKIKVVKSKDNYLNNDRFSPKDSSTCRPEETNPNAIKSNNLKLPLPVPYLKQKKKKSISRKICGTKDNLIPLARKENNCKESKLDVEIFRTRNATMVSGKSNADADKGKSLKLSFQSADEEQGGVKSVSHEICGTNGNLIPLVRKGNNCKERKLKTDPPLAKDNANLIPREGSTDTEKNKHSKDPVRSTCIKNRRKPAACETCGWRFKFKSQVVIHQRTHTGERPFKCVACKRSFTQHGSLYRHRRLYCPGKQGSKLNTRIKRNQSSKKRNSVKIEVITLSSDGEY